MHFAIKAVALAAGLLVPIEAICQSTYNPGQTFSTASTPAPYSNIQSPQQQPQYNVPPGPSQPYRPASTPLYNMGNRASSAQPAVHSTPRAAAPARSAATAGPRKDSPAKAASAKLETATKVEKTATEKPQVTLVKKADQPEPETESATQSEAAETSSVAEPTDKLVFFSRKTGKKQVALTYDDGPNPAFTPRLAAWLKENNVPATFFVCGNMVKQFPDHLKALADDGFELANHTYNHPDLRKLSTEKITEQLQDTHDAVKEVTGIDMKLMRPPYGAHNSKVDDVCKKLGYKIINWDVDTEDWRKRSATTMMNTIMKKTGDGSIILMHDRKHGGQDTVLDTTKQAVEKLRAKGYTFVSVGELIGLDAAGSSTASIESEGASEVSAAVIPLVQKSGDVTTSTLNGPLPTPAVLTPAPALP